MVPVIDYQLHFVFLCIINHLRWWVLIVTPMLINFFVRGDVTAQPAIELENCGDT
jgi:hypothetical protein